MLRGRVRAGGREGDRPGDGDDVHDVRAARGRGCAPQAGHERARAPDAAEVVRLDHALDGLGRRRDEGPASGNARVVDEQRDRGMPLEDARRDLVDLGAVAHVAHLPLGADLARDRLETVGATREEHAVPAPLRELARRRLADARGGSGDHGDSLPGHRRATLSD